MDKLFKLLNCHLRIYLSAILKICWNFWNSWCKIKQRVHDSNLKISEFRQNHSYQLFSSCQSAVLSWRVLTAVASYTTTRHTDSANAECATDLLTVWPPALAHNMETCPVLLDNARCEVPAYITSFPLRGTQEQS